MRLLVGEALENTYWGRPIRILVEGVLENTRTLIVENIGIAKDRFGKDFQNEFKTHLVTLRKSSSKSIRFQRHNLTHLIVLLLFTTGYLTYSLSVYVPNITLG